MSNISVDDFISNYEEYLIIDVRSEGEFDEYSILGSHNISILNNDEKHTIGKLYKQNQSLAYRMGLEVGSAKLISIYDEIQKLLKLEHKKKVLFYCFRGGTRSKSVYQSLLLLKMDCYLLEGGIKAYRKYILENLCDFVQHFNFLVVAGNTGCGKTKYLKKVKNEGLPIIDLEGLANNRGSIFGSIGLGRPTNQKNFDSLLFFELRKLKLDGNKIAIVESESKKIGNALLPNCMMDQLNNGRHILIECSIKKRVENIKEDYLNLPLNKERIITLINNNSHLKFHLGKDWNEKLIDHLQANRMDEFIKQLLVDYYDVLYSYSRKNIKIEKQLFSDDEEELTSLIKDQYLLMNQSM